MNDSITIAYPPLDSAQIKVFYAIEQSDDIQTINCSIEGKSFPVWLQLRKFSMSSLMKVGGYVPLYNAVNDSKNMDTSLFIDLVYASIMKLKRFNVN